MIESKTKPWTGKVRVPGIYAGMPIKAYHSAEAAIEPSISSSGLRTIFSQSPKHYWVTSPYNPMRIEDIDESDALRFGRAAHHRLLGQTEFEKLFAVPPESLGGEPFSLRRNVCKMWRQQHEEEGKTFLKHEELDIINDMRDSLAEHPLIKHGILNGYIETSWFTKHKETGIWLKIRPDAAPNDCLDFVDLKTTANIDHHSLQRALYDYGYFIQAGLAAMVVKDILNEPINSFSFVFIEKKPPYDIAVVTLKDNEIARGIRAAEHSIARFAACLKTGNWPGRYADKEDAQYIEMPEWTQKAIDARLA